MPELQKAVKKLKYLSHDRSMRLLADQQEKLEFDRAATITRAKREERKEMARTMLLEGAELSFVIRVTKLSKEEVLTLQADISIVTAAPTKEG